MTIRRLVGQTLLEHLRGQVNKGCLSLPLVRASDHYSTEALDKMVGNDKVIDNLLVRRLQNDEDMRAKIRVFAKETFYKFAPVPFALGLSEHEGFVNQELDMMFESGLTYYVLDPDSGALAGMCLNTGFPLDEQHEVVEADSLEWLNTAAIVAEESADSGPESAAIWRDLQMQNLYNIIQRRLRESEKRFGFYGGMGYVMPKFRRSATQSTVMGWHQNKPDSMGFFFVVTNPYGRENYHAALHEDLEEMIYVPYSQLTFRRGYRGADLQSMPNVFEALEKLNCGLTFFGTKSLQPSK